MNVNINKLVLNIEDYYNCEKTAWKLKFKNYWGECDVWCSYAYYYFYANKIAQVYIIDAPFIPKGTIFYFPFYVKSYNPELFSSYTFNNEARNTQKDKDFIVGKTFITNQDITSGSLEFYLTSDIKVPRDYILNKYRVFYTNVINNISVYVNIDNITVLRYIQTPLQIKNINTTANCTVWTYLPKLNISLTTDTVIQDNRYNQATANFSSSSSVDVLSYMTWADWDTPDGWGSFDEWM